MVLRIITDSLLLCKITITDRSKLDHCAPNTPVTFYVLIDVSILSIETIVYDM